MIPEELERRIGQARQEVRLRDGREGGGAGICLEAEHSEMMQTTSSVLPASERRACAAVNEENLSAVLHTLFPGARLSTFLGSNRHVCGVCRVVGAGLHLSLPSFSGLLGLALLC